MLRILEDKGHLTHESDGPRYVFLPTIPREQAGINAGELSEIVNTPAKKYERKKTSESLVRNELIAAVDISN